jgi:ribosomal protein S18 acetylase RimI-like enzyme
LRIFPLLPKGHHFNKAKQMFDTMTIVYQRVRDATGTDWPELLRMSNSLGGMQIPDNAHILVAENADKLIGMAACHQPSNGSMVLSHLFVDQKHRRQGIGTALLSAALAFAGPKTAIELQVARTNTAARRFYRANGFRLTNMMSLVRTT